MDINPIESLAFSMQARPKLYALLLGSGVSTAAGVPTGWEVVLDLVCKLMAMQGEKAPDPHKWYRDKYGSDPDYSALIERIAPTPAERQQILRQYWEANPTDGTEASKRPTAAHRAIADLVQRGFVKVIVTTNFDHLIESALREAGIEPVVLSSLDNIAGMMPLDHTNCCVLKLHGDYLDQRIRNTTDELSEYPDALNDILDRILQEYGLVVCGWSGEWDVALSKAIRRATARRYTTYWAAYGTLGEEAKRIIEAREARVIEIESADGFFEDLSGLVRAIGDYATPHPLSVNAAVAQCKQFLARDEDRIRLEDLVDSTGEEAISGLVNLPALSNLDGAVLTNRMRRCEDICNKLLAVAVQASYRSRYTQIDAWRNVIERLFQGTPQTENELVRMVMPYPAVLLTYALGIGAMGAERPEDLARILTFPTGRDVESWSEGRVMKAEENVGQCLRQIMVGMAGLRALGRYDAINDRLCQSLRKYTTGVIPADARYERMFDKVEVLISLCCGLQTKRDGESPLFLLGRFVHRREIFDATVKEIRVSLIREQDKSPFVPFVGDNAMDGLDLLDLFLNYVETTRSQFPYS